MTKTTVLYYNNACAFNGTNKNIGVWLSLVERLVRDQEAEGSNPFTPTKKPLILLNKSTVFYYFDLGRAHYFSLTELKV